MEIKRINPDSEYLFIKNSRPLATVTFNRRIKKCCKELGIEYRSSHKVRFSTASIMHKNGATDTELQEMLGHTTLTMTNGYLKNITPRLETYDKTNRIRLALQIKLFFKANDFISSNSLHLLAPNYPSNKKSLNLSIFKV